MFGLDNKAKEKELRSHITEAAERYRRLFNGAGTKEDADWVLRDLARRCFDKRTTYPGEDKIGEWGMNEGRRSIYKYITNLLEKDSAEIFNELTKGE